MDVSLRPEHREVQTQPPNGRWKPPFHRTSYPSSVPTTSTAWSLDFCLERVFQTITCRRNRAERLRRRTDAQARSRNTRPVSYGEELPAMLEREQHWSREARSQLVDVSFA
jgi:hypothetical protein